MMRLDELLKDLSDTAGNGGIVVSGLALDSRQVAPGYAFVALAGGAGHGIDYLPQAIAGGAVAVLAEGPRRDVPATVPVLWIDGLREQVGELAARFHGDPSARLRVIGVTGTNGKTSTVQMLAQALERLGHRAATIGTLGAGLHGQLRAGERTTPDAISVQRLLADFLAAGATHVAMEVSSHALVQGRVDGVRFEVAAFSNLTRDHLDYHGDMQAYGAAKARLFAWPGLRQAAINIDDPFGAALAAALPPAVTAVRVSAAGAPAGQVVASGITASAQGLAFALRTPWGEGTVQSGLLGRFNVDNLLLVAACLGALGEPFGRLRDALEVVHPVEGRMSRLGGEAGQPLVVVDYAHTPDALEQALTALRSHCSGRLLCVFGCGGERDPGKRPLMGGIAARLADLAIVTDDNPRTEDGDRIVAQIVQGMRQPPLIERDRAAAIGRAIARARAGDVVLIAGKGHETYQEGAQGRRPFDDLAVARAALERQSRESAA